MSRVFAAIGIAVALSMTACGSSSTKAGPSAGTTTTLGSHLAEALRFREVKGYLPYKGARATSTPTGAPTTSTCENGKLVTPPDEDTANNPQVILADKADNHGKHQLCYVLGPTLLTGKDIGKAAAFLDEMSSGWQINVTFTNDDFVTKVAQPYVNKNVAIVLDGVVLSAPTINPGITGGKVTISGDFTEGEARDLARRLSSS